MDYRLGGSCERVWHRDHFITLLDTAGVKRQMQSGGTV
jgi:hypothetical protein